MITKKRSRSLPLNKTVKRRAPKLRTSTVKKGDLVTVVTKHGTHAQGVAVKQNALGWVLDTRGRPGHKPGGRPAVATLENVLVVGRPDSVQQQRSANPISRRAKKKLGVKKKPRQEPFAPGYDYFYRDNDPHGYGASAAREVWLEERSQAAYDAWEKARYLKAHPPTRKKRVKAKAIRKTEGARFRKRVDSDDIPF